MAKVDKPRIPSSSSVLARLFPDLPVDDGEALQFDFEGPARTLAELALNPDNRTPFTVVVKGGSGRANARTFLRQEEELGREKRAGAGEGVATGGRLAVPQLAALTRLTDGQLHLLVHLASPAAAEVRWGPAVGRVDLLDLDSGGWIHLPGGTFFMGSEHGDKDELPVHRVTLSRFSIARFPMTNADYAV